MKTYRESIKGKRESNQDYTCLSKNQAGYTMAILCDGMGGHRAGDKASRMAGQFLSETWQETDLASKDQVMTWAKEAINEVNRAIYEKGLNDRHMFGMGSTVVLCVILDEDIIVANVGDSRAYQYVNDQVAIITDDHSFAYELYLKGEITKEEAATHRQRNMLTRSLGLPDDVSVDIFQLKTEDVQMIILCSDGLSDTLSSQAMAEIIENSTDIDQAGSQMVEAAFQNGSTDNITVMLVDLDCKEEGGS